MNISIKWTKRLAALALALGLPMSAYANPIQTMPGGTVSFGIQNGQVNLTEGTQDPQGPIGVTHDFFLMTGTRQRPDHPFISPTYVSSRHSAYSNYSSYTAPVLNAVSGGFTVDLNSASSRLSGGRPLGVGPFGSLDCCGYEFVATLHGVTFLPDPGFRVDHYVLTMSGHAFAEGGSPAAFATIGNCQVTAFVHPAGNCGFTESNPAQPYPVTVLTRDGFGSGLEGSTPDPWIAGGSFLYAVSTPALGNEFSFNIAVMSNIGNRYPGGLWSIEMEQISVRAVLVPVPEPSSVVLMGLAGVALALRVRTRQ